MIEIIQENCSSKEFYDDLKNLVEMYSEELTGSIAINVTRIITDTPNDIVSKYRVYSRSVERSEEYPYISEWSPNNGSVIGKLIKVNPIIKYLTESLDNYSKYQSVDLLEVFDDYIYQIFADEDDIGIIEVLEAIRDNKELEFIKDAWTNELVKQFEDFNDFKRHFLQTLDVFYTRNPKFRINW